jgi:single-strand DNA-binding protein
MFNKVIVMGNLTRDPELRYTPSGVPVSNFGLALNRRYQNGQGSDVEEVSFVEITAWGKQAEVCAEYLAKGSPVLLEGRLRQDRWETADGDRRSQLKVVAESVKFLPRNGRPEREPGEDDLTFPPPGAEQERPVEEPKTEEPPKPKRARKAKAG